MSHVVRIGATRSGKTEATVADIARSNDAEVDCDPHKNSLARKAVVQTTGNVLYGIFSDIQHSIGFELITPSVHPDPRMRALENHLQAEDFVQMLKMANESDSFGPLQMEWSYATLSLFLNHERRFAPSKMCYAFQPGTSDYDDLLRGARNEDREKFEPLKKLSLKGLRAEVGSTFRPFNLVFNSPIFSAWSRGGFDLERFFEDHGKLLLERGAETGDATMRMLFGAITLQAIKIGMRRKCPEPIIRIRVDEVVNAGLDFPHLIKATAETAKSGVFVDLLAQNLNFRNRKSDEVLQNSLRHEWYRCPLYSLAHEAAVDVLSGLGLRPDETRTQALAELTEDIQNLKPGWRWVRDQHGSRREYSAMLANPWPDWPGPNRGPGLRELKLQEKLQWIYSRDEYRVQDEPTLPTSSKPATPPSISSPDVSSAAAARLKQRGKRQADVSRSNEDEAGSESGAS